jgi:phage-related baseplate assembly protein
VQNVDLLSPPADIVIDRQQAGHCTGITITDGGVGE